VPGVNKAIILGNIGRDPEIRSTQGGERIATLSVATSESWRDKASGEKKEKTEWHRISVWGPVVDVIEKYVNKGDRIYIEGKIETRKWTDQQGQERYSTEIVVRGFGGKIELLGERRNGGGGYSGGRGGNGYGDAHEEPSRGGGGSSRRDDDLNDEIPF
jgi:single-strand DNA-binding protein